MELGLGWCLGGQNTAQEDRPSRGLGAVRGGSKGSRAGKSPKPFHCRPSCAAVSSFVGKNLYYAELGARSGYVQGQVFLRCSPETCCGASSQSPHVGFKLRGLVEEQRCR